MINPYAASYIIAARMDRSLLRHREALSAEHRLRKKRWPAPRHWRSHYGEDL